MKQLIVEKDIEGVQPGCGDDYRLDVVDHPNIVSGTRAVEPQVGGVSLVDDGLSTPDADELKTIHLPNGVVVYCEGEYLGGNWIRLDLKPRVFLPEVHLSGDVPASV